jgi:hypothetical protein
MERTTTLSLVVLAVCAGLPALAQSSASYEITDRAMNAGGHPAGGVVMSSGGPVGYRVTLDAIGDGVVATGMHGGPYVMDAGFVNTFPPPGEVSKMWFNDHDSVEWQAEKSAGAYNVYRDLMSNILGLGYGQCFDPGVPTTTDSDPGTPPAGDGWFYLVTAENRLGEEGTKGWPSSGPEREGTVCP